MYVQMVDDSKVQFLSDRLFKFWVNILAVTSRERGYLPEFKDLSFKLRLPLAETEENIAALLTVGLLDWVDRDGKQVLQPHNWFGRQPPQDLSTGRVHRFRKREKARRRNGEKGAVVGTCSSDETGRNESETRFGTLETSSTSTVAQATFLRASQGNEIGAAGLATGGVPMGQDSHAATVEGISGGASAAGRAENRRGGVR
jgi:hypothetical protein